MTFAKGQANQPVEQSQSGWYRKRISEPQRAAVSEAEWESLTERQRYIDHMMRCRKSGCMRCG